MRLYGLGMPKDEARAAEAFRLSAEKGSTDGETALGMMLYNGHMGTCVYIYVYIYTLLQRLIH
jgi:TPR repeat protein